MNKEICIKVKNISKVFRTDEIETTAINNISLDVAAGDFLGLTGPSGCGKSTLLSVLGLLDTADKGDYELLGVSVTKLSSNQMAMRRNSDLGFIFQSFNLLNKLSVIENVKLPLTFREGLSAEEIETLASDALEVVGLSHRTNHLPSQLSGGQQQRVAIARAIAGNPKIILADEPTGNLDSKSAKAIMDKLAEINAKGTTIVMVTHEKDFLSYTNRTIYLRDGEIVDGRNEQGTVDH